MPDIAVSGAQHKIGCGGVLTPHPEQQDEEVGSVDPTYVCNCEESNHV
jgi:hypothetical protein